MKGTLAERFSAKFAPEPYSGCWLWTAGINSKGYGHIGTHKGRKIELAHRIAWNLYRGEIPVGVCVLHKCDTPLCVNPDHLYLGSLRDNMIDMAKKYRHPWCKLTPTQIEEIRSSNLRQREIAKQYGISQPSVSLIKARKVWN